MKLRASLEFIQNGLSILKLKRDRLAEEFNSLLKQMGRRDKAEEQLMNIYSGFKLALARIGDSETHSAAYSTSRMKVKVLERPIMNVAIPKILVEEKPILSIVGDLSLHQAGVRLQGIIEELLEIACIETGIERLAYELTLVNRKINAIEKTVIPVYQDQVKYIEAFLSDEELEDFTRIKQFKSISREKRT